MRNALRPYIAVIVDSFREAFATRVLWVVLLLVGLLLAALAPFTFRDAVAVTLRYEDFRDARGVLLHLREQADKTDTPAGYLWSRLSESLQDDIAGLSVDSDRRERMEAFGRFRSGLNLLLRERDFYRDEVWKSSRLNREGRDLLKQGVANLSDGDLARFNRLALDAALPQFLEPAATNAVQFEYAGYELGDELPFRTEYVHEIGELVLAFVVSWLIGFAGVLAAIVVTASIVPRMLEPGSIDLLLSKPVSRWGLFLSRFAGGCAFILLVTGVLICGLWLIVGTRLGIWNAGLLWTIPVFVFVFAVYFSVSALAGVLWRNPIVSIIVSLVFWVACFVVGLTKGIVDDVFLSARRPAAILPLTDALLVVNRQGNGFEWDPDAKVWQTVFETRRRGPGQDYPFVGPVYDAKNDRLVAIKTSTGGPPWMREAPKLALATRDDDWKFSTPLNVPSGSQSLLVLSDGTILTAGTDGLSQLAKPKAPRGLLDMLSLAVPIMSNSDPAIGRFERVPIDDLQWRSPVAVAAETPQSRRPDQAQRRSGNPEAVANFDRTAPDSELPEQRRSAPRSGLREGDAATASSRCVVVTGPTIAILNRSTNGQFSIERQTTRDSEVDVVLGFAADRIVIAEEGGQVRVLNADDLSEIASASPFGKNDPKSIAVSPDGRQAAVVFHHRRLCLIDLPSGQVTEPPLASQGDISAAAYGPDGSLLVAYSFGQVVEYADGRSLEIKARYETPPDLLESVYQWGIEPLHRVFPKPGEMDNLVAWLMTREQTIQTGQGEGLSARRTVIAIWPPLWSNLAFLACVLTVSCLLISRRDF
ncbi:ABC transporter permease subunit [bacterium]|nr:ABC transporter permease subunit [bacterium]